MRAMQGPPTTPPPPRTEERTERHLRSKSGDGGVVKTGENEKRERRRGMKEKGEP